MADNLKLLIEKKNAVHNPLAPVQSILVSEINDFENDVITKLGRYTGFPFVSKRSPTAGVVPAGNLFWNTNAMNKSTPFQLYISNTTLDANRFSRILNLMSSGDLIHFKDFVGRSTTLTFLGFTTETDESANQYLIVDVSGFAENLNYAYQADEAEICMIEFVKTSNPQTFTTNENSKIWNTGDPRTFDMADLANPNLKPLMVFQSGAKLKRGTQWTLAGTVVTIDDAVELYDGDDITFPGII